MCQEQTEKEEEGHGRGRSEDVLGLDSIQKHRALRREALNEALLLQKPLHFLDALVRVWVACFEL